jgi:ubiquinol-cytochrome c reductase cytochrome c subunit
MSDAHAARSVVSRLVSVAAAGLAMAAAVLGAVLLGGGAPAAGQDAVAGDPERGAELYVAGCATCHGAEGEGVDGWPPIVGSGAAGADFQLRTGRMPHAGEPDEQAIPKEPAYDEQEIRDLVAFVATLGEGPPIPEVNLDDALLARGQELFANNCAPCHGAAGNGGALGAGAIAWPLTDDPPRIVVEAMVHGPGQMPVFDWPAEDRDAVATYVEYLGTAAEPGGLAIGGIGPVPEGLVAWIVGMALLAAIVYLVGRRWDRTGHRT